MLALTKKEILSQLKRLGINTLTELETYLSEYVEYYACCNARLSSR